MTHIARILRGLPVAAGLSIAALGLVLTLNAGRSLAADQADPDWPCIQRMVPEMSPGMVWAGPPLDGLGNAWKQDDEVKELARYIAKRRTSPDAAAASIKKFAEGAGSEKERRLTLLFAAVFEKINAERSSIMNGIRRYARKQRALAEKIEGQGTALAKLGAEDGERREALEERQIWDTRIYDEREQSLTFVCETPVLLEKRLFRIGREIMAQFN